MYERNSVANACKQDILKTIGKALNVSIKYTNIDAIRYIRQTCIKTSKERQRLYSQGPYPLHYAAESGDYETFKELLFVPEDVQIQDSCRRNIFHIISERGDKNFLRHVFRVFTGKNMNNNTNKNIVCDREKNKILENVLGAKATYKVREYVFACVQTQKRSRNGTVKTCQVPCYIDSIEKVRTPVDVALYRYDYTILGEYAKIPCARYIIYERIRDHLRKMITKRIKRKTSEIPRYISDLEGILNVMKTLSRDEKICKSIVEALKQLKNPSSVQTSMPQTARRVNEFCTTLEEQFSMLSEVVATPEIQNRVR
jgi:hypothetical protein